MPALRPPVPTDAAPIPASAALVPPGGVLAPAVGVPADQAGVLLGGPAPRPLAWAGIAVVASGLALGFRSRPAGRI